MSTIVQVTIGLMLLLAGLISVIAAVLGNPIRLGALAIPGPDGAPARGIVAGLGATALALCAIVFIIGGSQGPPAANAGVDLPSPSINAGQAQADTGADSGSVGGLPALTPTPTPTGSPKPPPAPSTAPPVPGKPTVTMIKVSAGPLSGCDQTYRASVNVANGPVSITYVISVDGYVHGPNPRTATVTGSTANLDEYRVSAERRGEIVYNILTPNKLSDQKTWSVPAACQPAFNIGAPYAISAPGPGQNCSAEDLVFRADLNVTAPPSGMNITYHVEIDGVRGPDHVERFLVGVTRVGEGVSLPDNPAGFSVRVRYVVTAPLQDSAEAVLSGQCTSPEPPPPDPPETTDPPPPTEDPTEDPPPVDPPVDPVSEESSPGPTFWADPSTGTSSPVMIEVTSTDVTPTSVTPTADMTT